MTTYEVEFEELYYYGVIMMAHSVVTIFKDNSETGVPDIMTSW